VQDAERYREHAAECERMARTALNPRDRASFDEMARQWRQMADAAESAAAEAQAGAKVPSSPSNSSTPVFTAKRQP
jgi:uncharacterized protein (DUF885 family)